MTQTTTQTTTGKSSCGCGSSGAASSALGCSCGQQCACGGRCETCQPQVYARPQFFAGQLLTEDDLQSLGDYVVAKNRLHNRYLFGDGVVCGLTVTCPPCESGHVTVNPGYALDCCGNDIVVSCSKDLDINQMVRQLMLKLRKADCGDPCADAETTTVPGTASRAVAATGKETAHPTTHPRRYCLYVDYCEQSSDPVAPYATNDTCGQAVCEATRIRESYRFELRCPAEHESSLGVGDRFWACVGDRRVAERVAAHSEFLREYLPPLKEAMAAVYENPAPRLDPAFWKRLGKGTEGFKVAFERFRKQRGKEIDEGKVRPLLDHVLHLASDVARVWVHPTPGLADEHWRHLSDAETQLMVACEELQFELIEQALPTSLERLRAFALLDLARELVAESRQSLERWRSDNVITSDRGQDLDFHLLAAGVVFNARLLGGVAESLTGIRDWLVGRLEQQGGTHCALLCEVNAVALPAARSTAEANAAAANLAVSTGGVLVPAVHELLRSCFCNALIPQCPPCDDPGVLLACLTVHDCKVTDICNLDRKFVFTAPNIRYWFPEIGRIGEALEEWCCPSCQISREDINADSAPEAIRSYEENIHTMLGRAPLYAKLAMSPTLGAPGSPVGSLESLGLMVSNVRRTEDAGQRSAAQPAGVPVKLQRQLESAQVEIENLKRDLTELVSRMAKIEKSI